MIKKSLICHIRIKVFIFQTFNDVYQFICILSVDLNKISYIMDILWFRLFYKDLQEFWMVKHDIKQGGDINIVLEMSNLVFKGFNFGL